MGERIKASRYNHFVEIEDGKRLAFNALSCGLAEMDAENYRRYCELIERGELNGDGQDDFVANLKKGGMVVPVEVDELDGIRAAHYIARFGQKGLGLTIVPTQRCNFACDYCYENKDLHSMRPDRGGLMSEEICKNLVQYCEKQLSKKTGLSVTWYGGEPLLAKQVIKRLTIEFERICKEKDATYSAGMITNGYLLDAATVDWIVEQHIRSVQVTIDGPREVHDVRRPLTSGKGTFDVIIANIDRIPDDKKLRVGLRVNIDDRNSSSVCDLLQVFQEHGWHARSNVTLHFGHVLEYAGACLSMGSHCMGGKEFAQFLVDAYQAALDLGFRNVDYPSQMPTSCAAVGLGSHVIEPNGDVQACWTAIGHRDKRIGVLDESGIKYTDSHLKWLGWSMFQQPMGCTSCSLLPVCMGGCPFKSIYPEDIKDSYAEACTSFRHNLPAMLQLTRLEKSNQ
ncbi:MAG: radical SAM protein [Candidatus Zixiibacteriota bacterium]